MEPIIENDVRYYNLRKLAEAKRMAGGDDSKVLENYERLAGKYDIMPKKKKTYTKKKTTTKKKAK